MNNKHKPVTETRLLSRLKPHPLQDQYFKDLTPGEFTGLADDIKRNGLKQPIEILPNGTIIQGHQRTKALKHLGHKEHAVLVRHDLADATDERIERELLSDNLHRRQLGLVARARVAARLFDLEQQKKHAKPTGDGKEGQVRNRIGQVLGMSGRNLSRYLRLLKTPLVVQNAVDDGKLAMGLALKVADLDGQQQEALVDAIKGGIAVREAVTKVFGRTRRPATKRVSLHAVLQSVLKICRQHEEELRGAETQDIAPYVGELKQICELLKDLWAKRPRD